MLLNTAMEYDLFSRVSNKYGNPKASLYHEFLNCLDSMFQDLAIDAKTNSVIGGNTYWETNPGMWGAYFISKLS